MARKVFISFLGTNNYVECIYKIGYELSDPVRFVQEALINDICKDWSKDDQIYIFCTSKEKTHEKGSKEYNWEDNGQDKVYCDIERIGLQHRLNDLKAKGLKPIIEEIDICAGFTEDEIWSIFETVFNKLKKDDLIYFDVTHAFRSIPLFSVVLFNYSKYMLNTQVVSVMYGAFEKLGPAYMVRERPIEERIAEVIDLTNIIHLQQYNQLASSLKEFGRVSRISAFINNKSETSNNNIVNNLKESIEDLDNYIVTINIQDIKEGKFVIKFRNNINVYRRKYLNNTPIDTILKELEREMNDFTEKNSFQNLEAAINWTIRHEMFTQTYPLAEEYVILRIADEYKEFKPKGIRKGKSYRLFISSILGMSEIDFSNRSWNDKLNEFSEFSCYLSDQARIIEMRPKYEPLRSIRNSLMHGNGEISIDKAKDNIPKVIECLTLLSPSYADLPSTKEIKKQLHIE